MLKRQMNSPGQCHPVRCFEILLTPFCFKLGLNLPPAMLLRAGQGDIYKAARKPHQP